MWFNVCLSAHSLSTVKIYSFMKKLEYPSFCSFPYMCTLNFTTHIEIFYIIRSKFRMHNVHKIRSQNRKTNSSSNVHIYQNDNCCHRVFLQTKLFILFEELFSTHRQQEAKSKNQHSFFLLFIFFYHLVLFLFIFINFSLFNCFIVPFYKISSVLILLIFVQFM